LAHADGELCVEDDRGEDMRAFLCHASTDKHLVGLVAQKLGRASVAYDAYSFEPGQDFRDEILRHLDTTDLFVFIVSKASLDSAWCHYELRSAEMRRMKGGISAQLAFIVDSEVSYDSLPGWLGSVRVTRSKNANQIAREVSQNLLTLSGGLDLPPFVGREDVLADISDSLHPFDSSPPQFLIAMGLNGVGRRAVLQRVARDNLSLPFGPIFSFSATDTLLDLYLWLIEETAPVQSIDELESEAELFTDLPDDKKANELASRLIQLIGQRTMPCLVDEGGLLNENGSIPGPLLEALSQVAQAAPGPSLALALRRKPYIPDVFQDLFAVNRVGMLSDDQMRLLLMTLLQRMRIEVTEQECSEIVDYLDGYPPAAYFAAKHIREYGAPTLLANKADLEDFKSRTFERFLYEASLSEAQWGMLRYLAAEKALSLDAISIALDLPLEKLAVEIRILMDLCLVIGAGSSYSIAYPVRSAVVRVKGLHSPKTYNQIAERLRLNFWSVDQDLPGLAIIDASLRASAFSRAGGDDKDPFRALALSRVSVIHDIAQVSYNKQDYSRAADYAQRVLRIDADRYNAQELLFKCYVRLERWSDAEDLLEAIRVSGNRRYHFLRGFLARFQDRITDAIAAFHGAIRVGDNSYSVHRELSLCLLWATKYDEALAEVNVTLKTRPNDLHQLDRLVQIYLGLRDFVEADRALRQLALVDYDEQFINHRRATFWLKRHELDTALEFADKAVAGRHGRFSAHAQKINILIERNEIDAAVTELDILIRRYPNAAHDVQIGLRCKSLIRLGFWEDGLVVWNRLRDKSRPVHQGLRKALLLAKAHDVALSLSERGKAEKEAEAIAANLDLLDDMSSLMIGREFDPNE